MHQCGIRPPGWPLPRRNPPMSISADQVGVQVQILPANCIPPSPSAYQYMATNRQWLAPPFSSQG